MGTRRPITSVVLRRRARAVRFGRYPASSAARQTRFLVASLIRGSPRRARDAVAGDTAASLATSASVTARSGHPRSAPPRRTMNRYHISAGLACCSRFGSSDRPLTWLLAKGTARLLRPPLTSMGGFGIKLCKRLSCSEETLVDTRGRGSPLGMRKGWIRWSRTPLARTRPPPGAVPPVARELR